MCARGLSISDLTAFSSFERIPSRSVLFLLAIVCMVFPTSIGPHPSSSNCPRCSGKSGQKVKGSVLEEGMFSAILDPIEERKFLKVLAISVSFDESCPCMLSSEILLVLLIGQWHL